MTEVTDSVPEDDGQQQQARKKENNPFSEQEKHGEDSQRRSPGSAEEYQGNPSVQRRAPGTEAGTEDDTEIGNNSDNFDEEKAS
jgi:hypothetical protein